MYYKQRSFQAERPLVLDRVQYEIVMIPRSGFFLVSTNEIDLNMGLDLGL